MAAEQVRPTTDVDMVVEIATYAEYAELEEHLRKLGFRNDVSSGVICRYTVDGLTVDILPTGKNVLGFHNRWYVEGFRDSMAYDIGDQETIRIFSPPYFLASKIDAFNDRGHNDGRSSSDFEDIVYILNNRPAIWMSAGKHKKKCGNTL
jgi:predicted nucleotidyltransferase